MAVRDASPASTVLQGRYELGARIAAGGMGTVHRGWDRRLDRPVAVKLLHAHLAADAAVRARFAAEARHAARVRHPNVVAVLDADAHEGLPFIVMELVDGPSLRDVLARRTRLGPDELLALLTAACAGLDAIHEAGLVHRDVKPENLLHDGAGRLRVADFGISRALDSTGLTPAGSLVGSVQYVAPEVVLGSTATPASDQYSLGIVAFEALTGRTPLSAEVPLAVALRHARERVPAPSTIHPAIPPDVDRVVMTATAHDPGRRFASLTALTAAVNAAVAPHARAVAAPPRRPPTAPLPAPHAPTRRRGPVPNARSGAQRARQNDVAAPSAAAADARPAAAPRPAPARHRRSRRGRTATSAPRDASRAGSHPGAAAPAHRPVYIRARMSALALLSLAFTLVPAGMVVAPALGAVALRRINRSYGALRGEAVAGLAIVLGLLRLAGRLLA